MANITTESTLNFSKNTLKPCPFCNTNLNEFPKVMVIKQAVYGEYLQWKKDNAKILGTDTWLVVRCPKCGGTGPRGVDEKQAINEWNGIRPDLSWHP